jgi:hypothetical protein
MHTGNKYHREIFGLRTKSENGGCPPSVVVDVYRVLDAFEVEDPGCQHAAKKILCRGIRGKGGVLQDTLEAIDALIESARMIQAKDPMQTSHRLEVLDRAEALFSAVSTGEFARAMRICKEAKAAC